jgi:hypothetical protein
MDVCAALDGAGLRVSPEVRADCRLVVVLHSRHTAESGHVSSVVEKAVRLDLPILPVKLDATPYSSSYEYFLGDIAPVNALNVEPQQILKDVCDAINRMSAEPPSSGAGLGPVFDRDTARRDLEMAERFATPFRASMLLEYWLLIALKISGVMSVIGVVIAIAVLIPASVTELRFAELFVYWAGFWTLMPTVVLVLLGVWIYHACRNLAALGITSRT